MAIVGENESGLPSAAAFGWSDNISAAFAAFKRVWPIMFVGGCLRQCTQGGGSNISNQASNLGELASSPDVSTDVQLMFAGIGLALIAVAVVVGLVMFLVNAWLMPGWLRVHEEILRTGNSDWSTLFSGGDRFAPMAGWSLVCGVIYVLTFVAAGAPGFAIAGFGLSASNIEITVAGVMIGATFGLIALAVVWMGLVFGDYLITFDERGVFEALGESWALASGTRWDQSVLFGALFLVSMCAVILGLLACCVGLYITIPIAIAMNDFARSRAVLLYLRPRSETERWANLDAPI